MLVNEAFFFCLPVVLNTSTAVPRSKLQQQLRKTAAPDGWGGVYQTLLVGSRRARQRGRDRECCSLFFFCCCIARSHSQNHVLFQVCFRLCPFARGRSKSSTHAAELSSPPRYDQPISQISQSSQPIISRVVLHAWLSLTVPLPIYITRGGMSCVTG